MGGYLREGEKEMNTFGERLSWLLNERGITQRELALRTGLTESAVSRYVNNQREPRADGIVKICKALEVSADWLLCLWGVRE